ncbi:protein ZNRD2-like [Centruroides vittatus]|uniref:Sjoegren syndrome/scleroderma autoantigen 1 homolog n=1 Tax=Centruroides sculpturatus TaxID=218467 RepID=UPI000C6D2337|nr:Sjoegren syndrome/scleroderma autoantigen 1 homolog [Centruroides sculpturatus]
MDVVEDLESPWEPPSESEMKIIQARRDRQDKISSITGEYLLKGYKMLSTLCEICGTILLQNKQGANYCVACSEVDTEEHTKDDPALSNEAARKKAEEVHYSLIINDDPVPSTSSESSYLNMSTRSVKAKHSPLLTTSKSSHVISSLLGDKLPELSDNSLQVCFADSLMVVREKMKWATEQLKTCQNINRSIQLCTLLKGCAEVMLSLKQAEKCVITNHTINQNSINKESL